MMSTKTFGGHQANPRASLQAFNRMLGYVLAQATTIVVTTSIGKTLSLYEITWHRYLAVVVYVAVSAVNVVVATLAAESLDMSVYVPLFAFTKLLVNMFVGLAIWQDYLTISSWVAYVSVYVTMLLGVYLLSEIDLVEIIARRHLQDATKENPNTQVGDALND